VINPKILVFHTICLVYSVIGFGSTAIYPIQRKYVHYDCGCVISENGELVHTFGTNALSIPAVYIAYFATFGAMVSLVNDHIISNTYFSSI